MRVRPTTLTEKMTIRVINGARIRRITKKMVRFRTLGCYPLTGAVESEATSLTDIIQEMLLTRTSERQGRVIDHDGAGSMEEKKRQGYF